MPSCYHGNTLIRDVRNHPGRGRPRRARRPAPSGRLRPRRGRRRRPARRSCGRRPRSPLRSSTSSRSAQRATAARRSSSPAPSSRRPPRSACSSAAASARSPTRCALAGAGVARVVVGTAAFGRRPLEELVARSASARRRDRRRGRDRPHAPAGSSRRADDGSGARALHAAGVRTRRSARRSTATARAAAPTSSCCARCARASPARPRRRRHPRRRRRRRGPRARHRRRRRRPRLARGRGHDRLAPVARAGSAASGCRSTPVSILGSSGTAEAAQALTAGSRSDRRRRSVDDGLQPGRLDPRPARRAHSGGRLRRVRLRPGRLDDQGRGAGRSRRPGIAARQRRLRGRACSAARSASAGRSSCTQRAKLPTDLLGLTCDPLRPATRRRPIVRQINQSSEGDRGRGPDQPPRGPSGGSSSLTARTGSPRALCDHHS